ncbi:hypothetical protein [Pedobacter sp. SYP-B3415]|uniref:hypothetical protein n=1 Tax=Pedobacter sp. SYP-B3415 TaxID=2496641 RepID=UPI00101CDD1D|nr:hypothetical protein [Pedobacter sp. SYP-B3415]
MAINKIQAFLTELEREPETAIRKFEDNEELRDMLRAADLREITGDTTVHDKLLNISYDLAVQALNQQAGSEGMLLNALRVLVIEDFFIDYRDSYIRLALISHVAAKRKTSDERLLSAVKPLASERALAHLERFFSQSKAERSLKAFGLQEVREHGELSVRVIPPPVIR